MMTHPVQKFTQSVSFKIFVVGILSMLLLIPSVMIQGLIHERADRREGVVDEICSKWGGRQVIWGPVLVVPYDDMRLLPDGKAIKNTSYLTILPEELELDGVVDTEMRYRGIYKALLYRSAISGSGHFAAPDFEQMGVKPESIHWAEVRAWVGMSDMRGISEPLLLKWGEEELPMDPGMLPEAGIHRGVQAAVDLKDLAEDAPLRFGFDLKLNGSGAIDLAPAGKVTRAQLASPWASPSFGGDLLPADREIDDEGFTATWQVLHFNRSYPQHWTNNRYHVCDSLFGVRFFIPVDVYQKTLRTAKYAILFILCTFAALLLSEVLLRERVHPIQYLLVGVALMLFYTLLLALSEHLPFAWAYALSSAAVILLTWSYLRAIQSSPRFPHTLAGIQVLLFLYLYTVLQQEDYALLIGSIGLLALLGLTMYITRHIDWYAVQLRGNAPRDDQG